MKDITARVIGTAIFAVFLLGLILLGVNQCQKRQSMGVQSRVDQGQAGAADNSAADAVQTQGQANARERTSEDLSRTNEKEIRNAPGANDPVNPAARDAGLRSLCRRAAYRDSQKCKLFNPAAR